MAEAQGSTVGVFVSPLKRPLKRVNSNPKEIEVVEALVVKGGFLKHPELLPIEELPYGKFVKLTAKQAWLLALLSGSKCNVTVGEVITTLMEEVRSAVSRSPRETLDPILDLGEAYAGLAGRRASLDLSDDDDEVAGEDDEDAATAKQRKPKRAKLRTTSAPIAVVVRDVELCVAYHRRSIFLRADGDNLRALARLVRALDPSDVAKRLEEQKAQRSLVDSPGTKKNFGVSFLFCRNTWKVTYRTGTATKQITKGFDVSKTNGHGVLRPPSDYQKQLKIAQKKAMKVFNQLDESDTARYPESDSE
jgi:hypothetical protein